jgi:hypothetical protein
MSSGLPANLPSISKAKLPAIYEKAKGALARCSEIDECKDWADKAEALASYAKQAQDDGLRKMAVRIQARAIRRCGELLEKIQKGVNQHSARSGTGPSSRSEAASDAGLSRRQKRTALRVARVPGEEFDETVESDDPPTVTKLAERGKLPAPAFSLQGRDPKDFAMATNALGWLGESHSFCKKTDAKRVIAGMLPKELRRRNEIIIEARFVGAWLLHFGTSLLKAKE